MVREINAVNGTKVTVNHLYWTTDGWNMEIAPDSDTKFKKPDEIKLLGNQQFKRYLIVKPLGQ